MPSSETSRRRLLTVGGLFMTATLGGCSQTPPFVSDDSTRQLALSLSPLDGSLRDQFVVNPAETPPPWDEVAFNATLNGTTSTTRHRPFPARRGNEQTYARRNGTYYHLDSHVVDEETVTHPVLRLYEVGDPESFERNPGSPSSLPEVDRRAIQIAYFAARARGNGGGVPWGLVERDGYVFRDDEAIMTSELLDESGPSYVEYRQTIYEVSVTRETFHEAIYRPDVDPVADSETAMETILRAQLLDARLAREDLSSAEQDVLRQAMGDTYRESHPYSTAFESVLKQLDKWPYLDGNVQKDAGVELDVPFGYLLYDDRYFRYTLQFVSGR